MKPVRQLLNPVDWGSGGVGLFLEPAHIGLLISRYSGALKPVFLAAQFKRFASAFHN
jgi:hypothetical protein